MSRVLLRMIGSLAAVPYKPTHHVANTQLIDDALSPHR